MVLPGIILFGTDMRLHLLLLLCLLLLSACVANEAAMHRSAGAELKSVPLFRNLQPNVTVAVSSISDERNGDLTLLGDYLSDRVEAQLVERELTVKARKDIAALIGDAELSDAYAEEKIWKQAGADIIVRGSYNLPEGGHRGPVPVRVHLKAFRPDDVTLVATDEITITVAKGRLIGLMKVTGNIHQQQLWSVSGDGSEAPPKLLASLNKPSLCYRPGEKATLAIDSEVGAHLLIFNLSCDGNVVILHPSRYADDAPLRSAVVNFPGDFPYIRSLTLQPAVDGKQCREGFKVVATRQKVDFSFLPFPENQTYRGVNGSDIDKITAILDSINGFSQQMLEYVIDEGCR
jgi:hypothetical protein